MTALFLALAAGVAMLAGCDASADPPANAAAPAASVAPAAQPGDRIVSAAQLVGEYRVAGVDDASLDLPYGVSASVYADRIHVVADCLNFGWEYSFEGAALVTERVAVESCGRGLTPQEAALVAVFDAANEVSRNRANGIDLRGEGHLVTLFSQ